MPAAIGQQQHLTVIPLLRRDLLLLDQILEFLPFVLVELHERQLPHGIRPWFVPGSTPFDIGEKTACTVNPKNQC